MVEHVVVGPHRFSVHFVDECSKKKRVGEANLVANTISVRNDQSPSQLRSTVLHEIVHHVLWNTGGRHVDGWSEDIEEAVCCTLEGPLLELFTRPENEPLREWLRS